MADTAVLDAGGYGEGLRAPMDMAGPCGGGWMVAGGGTGGRTGAVTGGGAVEWTPVTRDDTMGTSGGGGSIEASDVPPTRVGPAPMALFLAITAWRRAS